MHKSVIKKWNILSNIRPLFWLGMNTHTFQILKCATNLGEVESITGEGTLSWSSGKPHITKMSLPQP